MILADEDLEPLINQGMITNFCDLSTQLTPNGIDLTLKKVEIFTSPGSIDFSNEKRTLPSTREIPFINEWIHLTAGSYHITFNEIVTVPEDTIALARPRSSLLRSGATIESAVWDAGFRGVSVSLLLVFNPYGISLWRNARLMQLVFVKMSRRAHTTYQGVYQQKP